MTALNLTPAIPPTTVSLFGREWTLVETNAPTRYDYQGIHIMGDETPEAGSTRLVLIPSDGVALQIGRYRSGLFVGVVSDLYSADTITDELLTRLERRAP